MSIRTSCWCCRAAASAAAVALLVGTAFAAPAAAGGGNGEHPKGGPPGQAGRSEQATVGSAAHGPPPGAPSPSAPSADQGSATTPTAPDQLTTAAAPALAPGASAAAPAESPGNRGTVKVHRTSTPDSDRRNEPRLCAFRIVGFGFPEDADLSITIEAHGGPNAGADAFGTTVTADQLSDAGDFGIAGPTLADGMYRLEVENTTAPGGTKQKVFKIDCGATGVDGGTDGDGDGTEVTDVDTDIDGSVTNDDVVGTSTGSGGITAVLGVQVQRTSGSAPTGTADAGAAASAFGVEAASGLLARTGVEAIVSVLVGLALATLGTLLVRRSRVSTMR